MLGENENVLGLVGEMSENKGNIEWIDNLVNDKLNDRELGVLISLLYEYKDIFDPKLKKSRWSRMSDSSNKYKG